MVSGETIQYIDGFQYKGDILQFVPTAEGYYDFTQNRHVYNLKDHSSNNRVSFYQNPNTQQLEILNESHYYPFGMEQDNARFAKRDEKYRYKYQGQERQDELNLNWDSFKWRNYDYALGRFMSVDPLVEQTGYAYVGMNNNPVNIIDPDGRKGTEWYRNGNTVKWFDSSAETVTDSDGNTWNHFSDRVTNNQYQADGGTVTLGAGRSWTFASNSSIMFDTNDDDVATQSTSDASLLVSGASIGVNFAKYTQYNEVLEIWRGKNGKMYSALSGRGPNQYIGSRGFAKAQANRIGIGGNALGIVGMGLTELDFQTKMNQSPGPNMTKFLQSRYNRDQAFNAVGFGGFYGAVASFSYNAGYLIEGVCNCNIQYNPYTGDFTPIEQTLTEYDNLGFNVYGN